MVKKAEDKLTSRQVGHIADLAHLKLTVPQLNKFKSQLSAILDFFLSLKKADTSEVKPTRQVTGLENITARDEISDSHCFSLQEALAGTTKTKGKFFKVKGVFDK